MKTKLGFYYYLAPVLYLCAAALFIFLHIAGERQTFSYSLAAFSVDGSRSGGRTSAVLKVYDREIDLNHDMELLSASGQDDGSELHLDAVTADQQAIRIEYQEGVQVFLTAENTLRVEGSDKRSPGASLGIREQVRPVWTLQELGSLPGLVLEREDRSVLLEYSNGSGEADGSSRLSLDRGTLAFIEGLNEDPGHFWFFRGSEAPDRSAYDELVRDYLERSYRGWKEDRFDSASDTWTDADGKKRFQERALVGMVAEGYRRRDPVDLNAVKGMSARHREEVSYLSAPYVGNIVASDEKRVEAMRLSQRRMQEYIQSGDPAIFSEEDHLVEWLLWSGNDDMIEDLGALIASGVFEEKTFTSQQLAGLIELYIDSRNIYPERFEGYESLLPLVDRKVLPRIRRSEQGLFLYDGLTADLKASLKAGYYLQELGLGESRELLEELGRSMVYSVLSLPMEKGILPAFLRDGEVQGSLLPESVYPMIAENRYVPRNVFLYKELSADVNLWTVAQGLSASRGSRSWSMSFSFPTGATHHMVIRNVPEFEYIELYGIRWNGTRQFQAYDAGGWYYDGNTNTLYAKVRHKRSREELVIHF